LGQFYKAIEEGELLAKLECETKLKRYTTPHTGLVYLDSVVKDLWHADTVEKQFSPGLGYQPKVQDAGGSVVITNLASAKEAIKIIVEQGEGEEGSPFVDPLKQEHSHYDTFMSLRRGENTFETYPVREDPRTSDYADLDPRLYQVSETRHNE
jgi:hypothetical protein